MNRNAWIVLGAAMAAAASGGYVAARTQDSRDGAKETWETRKGPEHPKLPAFAWQALSSPLARKAGLWTTAGGAVSRTTVHVDKAGIPDWVHAMADAQIGRGPDLDYEIEVYPDGSEVYEVYRKVDGRERQLSVKQDRSVYYLGTEHEAGKLPEPVAKALKECKGAVAEKCVLKEGPAVAEYHVKATVDGAPCRIRISKEGKVLAVQRRIPSEIEVPMKP